MKLRITKSELRRKSQFLIPIGVWLLVIISSFWFLNSSFATAMSKAANGGDVKENEGVFVGVFREGAPRNINYIKKYEKKTGNKPAMIMWYQDWAQNFPWDAATSVINYGAVPHIVWEPWYWSDHSKIKLQDIVDGKWDRYIETWAKEIKNFRHPVFLRIAHEFNIEGYPWGIVNNDKDPDLYIKAYRHIVDIFNKEKVKNVKWVWCFMNYSHPDESWNDWEKAYPGDEYVDWVGIDGYNWGTTQSWSDWQAFNYMFREQMRRSKKLWPGKPIMVAEFASATKGGDKAAWIKEIPGYLKSSMRDIDLIIWFDLKKEADWRIASDKKSLAAYKEIMKDPIFLSSGDDLANLKIPSKIKEKKVVYAQRANSKITIDGSLADWNKSSPLVMKDKSYFKEGKHWGGTKDLSGSAYLMWDDENLYLAAVIADKIPLVNEQVKQNIWNGDAIEMVLSVNPKADPKRTSFRRGDYQVGLGTGDGKKNAPTIWNWQRRRVPKGSEIKVRKTSSPLGYVLEAKIPWAFFSMKTAPAKGMKLGFDIAFDDADYTGKRERQFIWNGDYMFYKDPSVWGLMELR
ncbi:MAG: sugar-binding protein [Candidatus Margulisiibacteriota bacterium]|nr:sugar-binding protein [Candidatus Margulisiibacteriota bacterium]